MARQAVATAEGVRQAINSLSQEGLPITIEKIRAKLGGGSFSTISKILNEARPVSGVGPASMADMPADLADIGQRAVLSIYKSIQDAATKQIDAINQSSRRQIAAADEFRREAEFEISQLERQIEVSSETIDSLNISAQQARERAERAEGQLAVISPEVERLRTEIQNMLREREELAGMRGKLTADYERAKAEIERLRERAKASPITAKA